MWSNTFCICNLWVDGEMFIRILDWYQRSIRLVEILCKGAIICFRNAWNQVHVCVCVHGKHSKCLHKICNAAFIFVICVTHSSFPSPFIFTFLLNLTKIQIEKANFKEKRKMFVKCIFDFNWTKWENTYNMKHENGTIIIGHVFPL